MLIKGDARDFGQANRAFELFTLTERERALEIFARLRYPSVRARFFEAVYLVINEAARARDAAEGALSPP